MIEVKYVRKLFEHKKSFLELEHQVYKLLRENNNASSFMSGQVNNDIRSPPFCNSSIVYDGKLPSFYHHSDENSNCNKDNLGSSKVHQPQPFIDNIFKIPIDQHQNPS